MSGAQVIDFAARRRARLDPLERAFDDAVSALDALNATPTRAGSDAAYVAWDALLNQFNHRKNDSLYSHAFANWMTDAKARIHRHRAAFELSAPVVDLAAERGNRGHPVCPSASLSDAQKRALRYITLPESEKYRPGSGQLDWWRERTQVALATRGLVVLFDDGGHEVTALGHLVLASGQADVMAKEG